MANATDIVVQQIPLDLLVIPEWNSRASSVEDKAEQKELADLAASVKARGVQTPIEVQAMDDGKYLLVFGNRRVKAARLAGLPHVPSIVTASTTENERRMRNIDENLKRKNLTSYEEARVFAELRKMGLKNPEISSVFGVSAQKVSNLAVCMEKLPPPIISEWKVQNPVATDTFLRELATDKTYPTPEKKMQAWDEAVADAADKGKTKKGRGKAKDSDKGGSAGYPVSQKRLGHCLDALSSKKLTPELPDETRVWAKALLTFIVQGREVPPTGIPALPKKEPKADKS